MKISDIKTGEVGIRVRVKVVDPKYPKRNYKAWERALENECIGYLKIRLDPKVVEELFK